MNIHEMIPSLKLNVNIRNIEPTNMTTNQISFVFQIIDEILEEDVTITEEEQREFERYENSYLRKRILRSWQSQRYKLLCNRQANASRKLYIYQEIYKQVEAMLINYFQEEYKDKPIQLNILTYRAFLWNKEFIAKKFELHQDVQSWSEILEMVDVLREHQLLGATLNP